MSDTLESAVDPTPEPAEQSQSELSADDIGGTMLALHQDRIRRTDLAITAYQQSVNVNADAARRARRNVRLAWGVAGGVTVAMFLCVIWATHSVTKARGEVGHLSTVVRQLSDTADTRAKDADRFRVDAETARVATAR